MTEKKYGGGREKMEESRKAGFLSGTALKLIAMVCMVFDHVGDIFFPSAVWMRVIGRVAMPIFAFCIAEGCSHTHDRKKYLARLGVFALVSEIPFDLVTSGRVLEFGHQNIMATFFWTVLGLTLFDRVAGDGSDRKKLAAGTGLLILFAALSVVLRMDYSFTAFGITAVFYCFRQKSLWFRNVIAMSYHLLVRNVGIHIFGLLGFIPIFFYNGEKGRGLKWLFYLFYPGHLLLIYLLRALI